MKITAVHVEVGRTVSDGNYGSERVSVSLGSDLDPGEMPEDIVEQLAAAARALAQLELGKSPVAAIRRAVKAVAPEDERPF